MKISSAIFSLAMLLALALPSPSHAQGNSITFSKMSMSESADLGEATITVHVRPTGKSMSVGAQMYLHRAGQTDWDSIDATTRPDGGDPRIFALYRGADNVLQFVNDVPAGTYDGFRLLLFDAPDGQHIDYGHLVYDTALDPAHKSLGFGFKVLTSEARVRAPQLVYAAIPDAEPDGDGTYSVTIPAKLRLPTNYQVQGNGFWIEAKGTGGFDQVWVPLASAQQTENSHDNYIEAPAPLTVKGLKPGIWNLQFGIFKADWGDALAWVYPGLDFEIGGDAWETKATSMPPRLRYVGGRFVYAQSLVARTGAPAPALLYPDDPGALKAVKFARGGNFGNALDWTIQPALNSPGYFTLLGDIGCKFVRCLFSPDRFLDEPLYRHSVDQVVQNIWQSGAYPLIGPQDLPKGDTMAERIDKGRAVCRAMATIYKGKSVWIELCNEPHEFSTWAAWKPVAEQYLKTVRSIDPNTFVVVPFEFWSKDGRGAAADPIKDLPVDLYDGHAYISPAEMPARFGTATKAGLPVLVGEYGGDAAFMQGMDKALQALSPQPAAVAPWAFTIKGQDQMPLVENSEGAAITYTPAGQAVADAFDAWLEGKRVE